MMWLMFLKGNKYCIYLVLIRWRDYRTKTIGWFPSKYQEAKTQALRHIVKGPLIQIILGNQSPKYKAIIFWLAG